MGKDHAIHVQHHTAGVAVREIFYGSRARNIFIYLFLFYIFFQYLVYDLALISSLFAAAGTLHFPHCGIINILKQKHKHK